jgi:hypothetical protein
VKDPIVEEVRRYRMEHTQMFGGDLNRIYEELRRVQQESGSKLLRRPPKLLAPKANVEKGAQDTL